MERVDRVVASLAAYDCAPTFPTPGVVVEGHPAYFRRLQACNVEFAVHSYYHIDLRACLPQEARQQLLRAARAFECNGLEVHGFRCPYLSWSTALLDTLPKGLFGYGSNRAVRWDVMTDSISRRQALNYGIVDRLYLPEDANDKVCVPSLRTNMVEIPLCVPDDIQLYDALGLGVDAIIKVWMRILKKTHQRGELYNQMFHPELVDIDEQVFPTILQEAKALTPRVWITRMRDISTWWYERNAFWVDMIPTRTGLQLEFHCTPRATILSRGLALPGEAWADQYQLIHSSQVDLPDGVRPFIGVPATAPAWVHPFLKEQGYIVDASDKAEQCSIYLDPGYFDKLAGQVGLVELIEKSDAPLIRFWRWPAGCRSALCISGDLDALTLWDYMTRLTAH